DEVPQVREAFAAKLHKGLSKGIPNKCLPLDFMGIYALAGREPDKRIRALVRQYMHADVARRRDYVRNISVGTAVERAVCQVSQILPDYMLAFAVTVLTHDPLFERYDNIAQLKLVKQCLWFILEPLITRNDFYCYGFYKTLIERMKNHKDARFEDDDNVNYKMWAVCDLAMTLIWARSNNFEMREFPSDARIPTMFFSPQNEYFVNTRVFLPPELQFQPKKVALSTEQTRSRKRARPQHVETNNTNDVEVRVNEYYSRFEMSYS
ncbi:Sister chromatid cohesion protein PDS5 homolog B, partial [Eumeta japonica]